MKNFKKILTMMLIAAVVMVSSISCANTSATTAATTQAATAAPTTQAATETTASTEAATTAAPSDQAETKVFTFVVVDQDGNETSMEIETDAETVGEALVELDLIAGEDSAYGLYVKTVNGITADYDKDGVYWAFYINGEYASTGVDSTPVEDGATYTFKIEK